MPGIGPHEPMDLACPDRDKGLLDPFPELTKRDLARDEAITSSFFLVGRVDLVINHAPLVQFDDAVREVVITVIMANDQNGFAPGLELG